MALSTSNTEPSLRHRGIREQGGGCGTRGCGGRAMPATTAQFPRPSQDPPPLAARSPLIIHPILAPGARQLPHCRYTARGASHWVTAYPPGLCHKTAGCCTALLRSPPHALTWHLEDAGVPLAGGALLELTIAVPGVAGQGRAEPSAEGTTCGRAWYRAGRGSSTPQHPPNALVAGALQQAKAHVPWPHTGAGAAAERLAGPLLHLSAAGRGDQPERRCGMARRRGDSGACVSSALLRRRAA